MECAASEELLHLLLLKAVYVGIVTVGVSILVLGISIYNNNACLSAATHAQRSLPMRELAAHVEAAD